MKYLLIILFASFTILLNAQNVGIGLTNPTIGRFEIFGANNGGTVASFGTDGTGISLQRNWPSIGFNQYRDNSNLSRYMGNGKASLLYYDPIGGNFGWDVYNTTGTSGQTITASGVRALTILSNGNIGVRSSGASDMSLHVARMGNLSGTAVISGSDHSSYFAWNTQEDTYIRGGKNASKVIINDIPDGKILSYGKTAIGAYPGNAHSPTVAAEIWGPIALTNPTSINLTGVLVYYDGNSSSYYKVISQSASNALYLNPGQRDGQILIIENNGAENSPSFSMAGYIYSSQTIGPRDILTCVYNSGRGYWMPISFMNN